MISIIYKVVKKVRIQHLFIYYSFIYPVKVERNCWNFDMWVLQDFHSVTAVSVEILHCLNSIVVVVLGNYHFASLKVNLEI